MRALSAVDSEKVRMLTWEFKKGQRGLGGNQRLLDVVWPTRCVWNFTAICLPSAISLPQVLSSLSLYFFLMMMAKVWADYLQSSFRALINL